LEKCDGDASANNRKAKIIIFFEWELRLKWTAKLNNENGDTISGTIDIPNLSDENGISDLDVCSTQLN
jgi:activator of HSP90 ATPase